MKTTYAEEQFLECAERALAQGQGETMFIASCHPASRPAALKAYKAVKAGTHSAAHLAGRGPMSA
jgi:hypothetical protein